MSPPGRGAQSAREEYLRPRLREALGESSAELEPALEAMMQVATEYRRLSRLLKAGMLEYVLMRYRRDDAPRLSTAAGR